MPSRVSRDENIPGLLPLNSAHIHCSKVTYIKIIYLYCEGERRPGIEARKNHLFIFLFMKLSDEVEA